ncbi:uncharacterized protein LOC118797966 [Colossoma macropomum]|uniref:uncharacterized protein LOC118797966 n=1 Tax=Colossoma macropomum TaxID=42526 RepID=UPI0018649A60|nr:uncharacterized protein LOC118797966 [Colossoma macropomum]
MMSTLGKRKDRRAEGSRGPTKNRELKAAEDSGFNQLPPLRQEQEKTSQALNVAVHAQSYSVLPPIRGSCPPPVQAMKGDWLEKVGLDVHDDPSPPPPVQPENSSPDTDAAEEASQGLELTEVQEDSDQQSRTNESRRRSESAASGNLSAWSCSTVLSEPGLSSFEDLIRECGGSPDLSDLSDECSEIFTGYQNYRRYGHVKRPGTYLVECAEFPLEGSPDLSGSIPAVQVTEVSEDSEVENNEDLETPACPDGTEDDTTSRKTKKRRLRSRVFNFLRRVFCFGCVPSRRVEPL